MNKHALTHKSESKYCFPLSKNRVSLRFRISKYDYPDSVFVLYGGKYDFAVEQYRQEMSRLFEDDLFAYYITEIELTDTRLTYVFEISINDKTYYFSEDGLTDSYDFTYNYYNSFQYAYINEVDIHKDVTWMHNAVFYQIFIDRFFRADYGKNDAYINSKWGSLPTPKSFTGGDIMGIIEKLPYLKSINITTLYLTPIFRSISNHKYDISDYFLVDPQFGSNEIFAKLVSKAHKLGIKVVIDAVFNHTSDESKEFQDVIKNGKNSKYFDWFVINNTSPLQYECFASCEYMPKWNTSNSEVQKFLIDIALYWIREYNIDGWRLDVSDEVSHDFWREMRKRVKKEKPDCLLIGENWHDAEVYLRGEQFDGVMNYAFTKACLDFYAFDVFTPQDMSDKLSKLLMRNTTTANMMMLNLLDSHDTHRILTRLNGNSNRLLSAIALMYFYLGTPNIYYGTENLMLGGYDPDSRRTFDWEQESQNNAVKNLIKLLSDIKINKDVLSTSFIKIFVKDDLLIIERKSKKDGLRLIINQSGEDKKLITSSVMVSNLYSNDTINQDGFLIETL